MFSNMPSMLQQQDFNAMHRDIVDAARGGVTVDPKAAVVRSGVYALSNEALWAMFLASNAKIDEMVKHYEGATLGDSGAPQDENVGRKGHVSALVAAQQNPMFEWPVPQNAKLGTNLRVRMPKSYKTECSTESPILPPSSRD